MKTTTNEWLNFAKADLMNCEKISDEEFLTNVVAFHAQQAVEKSFKALIEEKGLIIPKVHSLQRLYNVIEQFSRITIDISELILLDSVYTSSRYPADIGLIPSGKPTIEESKELYESAKRIFETITHTIQDN